MNVQPIPINKIEVVDRLREVDPDWVALLAASIAVDGLRSPIEVRKRKTGDTFVLVAGAHRLAACRQAGLAEIDAIVLSLDNLEAKRREIEENLIRHDLTELDRAVFLAEWQQVYEALHPEARHGGPRRGSSGQIGHLKSALMATNPDGRAPAFSEAAAEKFGTSARTIRRAIKRHDAIAPDVRKLLSGTWLARKGVELDNLAKLGPAIQRAVVDMLLSGHPEAPTTVKQAQARVEGRRQAMPDETADQYDKLVKAWRNAVPVAQQRFLAWLAEQPGIDLAAFAQGDE